MNFWQINNNSNTGDAELIFYGAIVDSLPWWYDGQVITSKAFMDDLERLKNKNNITIRINSGGGDVFTATSICNELRRLKAYKTVVVDGVCASAATIIAMAADKVIVPANAYFMIHNPSITVWDSFTAKDLEMLKNALDTCKKGIIESYKTKTKLSNEEISKMMDDETWMTGDDAVRYGFADEVSHQSKVEVSNISNQRFTIFNSIPIDMTVFKNAPKMQQTPQISPMEDARQTMTNEEKESDTVTLEQIKNEHPQIFNEIKNMGVQEERTRLQEIEEISNMISPEILNKGKYENPMDAKTLAFENAKLDAKRGARFLNDLQDDEKESGKDQIEAGTGNQEKNEGGEEDQVKNISKLSNMLNNLKGAKK